MVCIKLPESAIQDIEMLIGKVLSDFIDIFFRCNLFKNFFEVRLLEIPKRYLAVIIRINHVEYAHYNCVCISILKLRSGLQKFQPRMSIKKLPKQRLKIFC